MPRFNQVTTYPETFIGATPAQRRAMLDDTTLALSDLISTIGPDLQSVARGTINDDVIKQYQNKYGGDDALGTKVAEILKGIQEKKHKEAKLTPEAYVAKKLRSVGAEEILSFVALLAENMQLLVPLIRKYPGFLSLIQIISSDKDEHDAVGDAINQDGYEGFIYEPSIQLSAELIGDNEEITEVLHKDAIDSAAPKITALLLAFNPGALSEEKKLGIQNIYFDPMTVEKEEKTRQASREKGDEKAVDYHIALKEDKLSHLSQQAVSAASEWSEGEIVAFKYDYNRTSLELAILKDDPTYVKVESISSSGGEKTAQFVFVKPDYLFIGESLSFASRIALLDNPNLYQEQEEKEFPEDIENIQKKKSEFSNELKEIFNKSLSEDTKKYNEFSLKLSILEGSRTYNKVSLSSDGSTTKENVPILVGGDPSKIDPKQKLALVGQTSIYQIQEDREVQLKMQEKNKSLSRSLKFAAGSLSRNVSVENAQKYNRLSLNLSVLAGDKGYKKVVISADKSSYKTVETPVFVVNDFDGMNLSDRMDLINSPSLYGKQEQFEIQHEIQRDLIPLFKQLKKDYEKQLKSNPDSNHYLKQVNIVSRALSMLGDENAFEYFEMTNAKGDGYFLNTFEEQEQPTTALERVMFTNQFLESNSETLKTRASEKAVNLLGNILNAVRYFIRGKLGRSQSASGEVTSGKATSGESAMSENRYTMFREKGGKTVSKGTAVQKALDQYTQSAQAMYSTSPGAAA